MPGHLIISRGYSGSGKTTRAEQFVAMDTGTRVTISRDEIRTWVFSAEGKTVLSDKEEKQVTKIEQDFVRASLRAGKTVYVADTNLVLRYARQWANIAEDEDAEFTVDDFYVDVEECVRRNAGRSDSVPEHVIRKQAKRWPFPWPAVTPKPRTTADDGPAPYVPDESLPPAIIVDLDGTLALIGDRHPYDASRCGEDTLDEVVSDIASLFLVYRNNYNVIFLSGRKEKYRAQTEAWLKKHVWHPSQVDRVHGPFMRASDDGRPDFVVKAELFDKHIRGRFDVRFVLDDRDQVVQMWRRMGLKVLQVADGAF